MYFIFYVSRSTHCFDNNEILDMLIGFRKNNKENDIVGMLFYKSGHFIQLIEGDENKVKSLYDTIEKDTRHTDSRVLLQGQIEDRMFTSWDMAYKNLDEVDGSLHDKVEGILENYKDNIHANKELINKTMTEFYYSL